MATGSLHIYRGVRVTARQVQLLALIDRRTRWDVPAVQRDLAEEMGIRRDSLNKLLARTRRTLAEHGIQVIMPARSRECAAAVSSLGDVYGL